MNIFLSIITSKLIDILIDISYHIILYLNLNRWNYDFILIR